MKKSTKIAIISGIVVAVIVSALTVYVHLRQSAIEVTEQANESASQKIKEVVSALTNQSATNPEANESPEQRASEGK